MKRIPIKAAGAFLKEHNLQQVIIICRDAAGTDHILTYGKTKADCREAGLGGDRLKRLFRWPESTLSKYSKRIRCKFCQCDEGMEHLAGCPAIKTKALEGKDDAS